MIAFSVVKSQVFLCYVGETQTAGKKKKKNRGKKKNPTAESNDSIKLTTSSGQTNPPTIPIVKLFSDGVPSTICFIRFHGFYKLLS